MKKISKILLMGVFIFGSFGCFKKDDLEGAKIYTTIYPTTYIVSRLYSDNSSIESIYPSGIDTKNYSLTNKQIEEYSEGDIFVYNGLEQEKQIAKDFLNENKKLKIIDVAYGLKYTYGIEELWLSPNNFLMLSSTVKSNLTELIDNKYLDGEIKKNYNKLEEEISMMDAELRQIGASAKEKGTNTIVTSSNVFKFLENYGFNVISLESEENIEGNNVNTIKSNFKNKKYTQLFMLDSIEKSELITSLESDYDATIIYVNSMYTLSEENISNNDDYISIMKDFIENIKNVTLG